MWSRNLSVLSRVVSVAAVFVLSQTILTAQVYNIRVDHANPDGPFCGFAQDHTLQLYVEGATGNVEWRVGSSLSNEGYWFSKGAKYDTLILNLIEDPATDTVWADMASVGGTISIFKIVPLYKKAEQPGVITQIIYPENLVCEGSSNTFSVPEDTNNYGIILRRYWQVFSAKGLQMGPALDDVEAVRRWSPDLAYADNDKNDVLNPVGGTIKITPYTCENFDGKNSEATPQTYNINKFVRKKLFTNAFLSERNSAIQALTLILGGSGTGDSYWKRISLIDSSLQLNACTYYSDLWNEEHLTGKEDPDSDEKLSYGFGDGYLYLQIGDKHGFVSGDHEPDTLRGEDMFHYEWSYDPLQLEQQTSYIGSWATNKFGENSYRTSFKVLENPNEPVRDITVSVKVTCPQCRTRNGISISDTNNTDFVQVFTKTFFRVDSMKNYTEYIPGKEFQQACAGQDVEFQIEIPDKDKYKKSETSVFSWVLPKYWSNLRETVTCTLPKPGECVSMTTGANPDNVGVTPGDTIPVLVYPYNGCFENLKDTGQNGKHVYVFVKNRPTKPLLYDSILHVGYNPEFAPPPPSTTDKQIFPVLMCNTNRNEFNIFKIINPGDSIIRHRVVDGMFGFGNLWTGTESPYLSPSPIDRATTSIFMPSFRSENLYSHAGTKAAIGFYAESECGNGDTAFYHINIIDTLSIKNSPILNLWTSANDYDDTLCEGETIELINTVSTLYTIMDLAGKDKNPQEYIQTDRVELVWDAPGGWTFNPKDTSDPLKGLGEIVAAKAGYASGTINARIRNKCGMGSPVSSKYITVHPYTRTTIKEDTSPCQGDIITYRIDTAAETEGYEWRLPDDWKFVDNNSNVIYTKNSDAISGPYIELDVIAGADSGYIYVVGKKDTSFHCNFDYANYPFHRRDSLHVNPRKYTRSPIKVGVWDDTLCARDILNLVVVNDDSDPTDLLSFTWIFPDDGFWLDTSFSVKRDTLYSVTVPGVSHYNAVIKVVANRADCEQTNIGDTLYYTFIVMDTVPVAGEFKDARYTAQQLDIHPCEGDTVYYILNQEQDLSVYSLEWFWNLKDTTLNSGTDSIDVSGWRVLSISDTLVLTVGADALDLGVRTRSYCGVSSLKKVEIIPTQHIRIKPHISVFDTMLCNGEQKIFKVDSVPFATDFVWYFPFGIKTDTTHDALENPSGREYIFDETKYDTGIVYVLSFNRCETGPYSDTIRIIDTLSPPNRVSLWGHLAVNDSVFDTICLRSDRDYFAYLDDTFYGVYYNWSVIEGNGITLSAADTSCTFNKSSGYEKSVVAAAARHKFCTSYGDSIFIVVVSKDTAIIPNGTRLRDYIFDRETSKPITFLNPCARDTVYYYFNKIAFGQNVDSAFFMWNGGNAVNPADSTMASTTFKLFGTTHSDTLDMIVGVLDSIFLSIRTHNSCGYSIIDGVKITAGEALPLTSQSISSSSSYFCQMDSVIIEVPELTQASDYVWYFPWSPFVDTAENVRVFYGLDFAAGDIYAVPYNGCGLGVSSDSIKIDNDSILTLPHSPVPYNFANGQIGTQVQDTLCVNDTLSLAVTHNALDADNPLVFKWSIAQGVSSNVEIIDSICKVTQSDIRDTAFIFNVTARNARCVNFGDTLHVKIFPADIISFSTVRNDTFFEILLDSTLVYENVSKKYPADIAICGEDTVLYETGLPQSYHWSVDSVWFIYPDNTATSWDYITVNSDSLYIRASNDSFTFFVGVKNICGITLSDEIVIHPNQAITDTPVIVHGAFCFDDGDSTVFEIAEPIDNAIEYVWNFPWNPYSVTTSLANKQPSELLTTGKVTVYARNGCGESVVSDTLYITDIHQRPQRPVPVWYDGLDISGDTVIDSVCLHTNGMQLSISDGQGDTSSLYYEWNINLSADILSDTDSSDNIATVVCNASAVAGDWVEIKVASRWVECNTFSDTLTIRLKIVDTAEAASLGKILITPERYKHCDGEIYTLSVENPSASPAYRWFLPEGWVFDSAVPQDTNGPVVVVIAAANYPDSNSEGVYAGDGYIIVVPVTDSLCRICSYYTPNGVQSDLMFTQKLPLPNNGFIASSTDTNIIEPCAGTEVVYAVHSTEGAAGYSWQFPDTTWKILPSLSNVITGGGSIVRVIAGSTRGDIIVRAEDTCGDGFLIISDTALASKITVIPVDTARAYMVGDTTYACIDSIIILDIICNDYVSSYDYTFYASSGSEVIHDTTVTPDPVKLFIMHSIPDTIMLVILPKNRSENCSGYFVRDTHYFVIGSTPTINGRIDGDSFVCYYTEQTYYAIPDPDEDYGNIKYRWELPNGWSAVGSTTDSVITVMVTPYGGDRAELRCYPTAMCGEAQTPFSLWITLNKRDSVDDIITVSDTNPCVNTGVDASLAGYYDPDIYSLYWVYPPEWDTSNAQINPVSIHFDIHSAGEQKIGVYYERLGACGPSDTLTEIVYVRDSASAAVLKNMFPCINDTVFSFVLMPDDNIDSAVWTIFAPDSNIFDRPESSIRNDSATVLNPVVGGTPVPITVNVTTFNSCYGKDTVITVLAIDVADNFSYQPSFNHFCIDDTGYAYIAFDSNHYKNAVIYTWYISDTFGWRILDYNFADSFNYVRFISPSDTVSATLMLTGKNSCGSIDPVYTAVAPYSFSVAGMADPSNVVYGKDSVELILVSVTPPPVSNYDISWNTIPEWRIFTDTLSGKTYTRTLVKPIEEFILVVKEKPVLSDTALPFYMRSSCCAATDTVHVFVDSTFTMISDSFVNGCLYETITLTVHAYGGNTSKYNYRWYIADENGDYIFDTSLTSNSESIVAAGDTVKLMIIGCDTTTVYNADLSQSTDISNYDTQYIAILVNYVDLEIIRPKREPNVPIGTSVGIEVAGYNGRGGYSYHWSSTPDDVMLSEDTLSNSNKTKPLFKNEDILIIVKDTITGCIADTVLSITLNSEFNNNLPNAFSPNGDGVNDVFMKGVDLLIFNRWGVEIFKSENKEGWDGMYKGKTVARGEYLYVITVENEEGEQFIQKGVVTVF
ncbi:MAG: gliding motility-associated C-terminal domain-containing protein [Bacteroidales bacterium]|jgi:gliding motility-associated-like protein|nr:gliding motility-associated C-terminal domain-containing protein [Bacteroidales bacterium]